MTYNGLTLKTHFAQKCEIVLSGFQHLISTSVPRDLLTCGAELGDVGCDPALAAAAIAAAINAFPEGVA